MRAWRSSYSSKIAEIMGVDVPAMDDVAEPEEMVAFINENMCYRLY